MTRFWTKAQPVAAIALVLGVIGIPLWLVLVTAAKSQGEALNPDLSLPQRWQLLENLRQVWEDGEVPAAFFGSLGLSVEHLGDGPERLRQQGQHVFFVAVGGRTAGFLGVADAGA